MSKQKGKEDWRKQRHRHGQKHHRTGKQHDSKFDEDRFLRDMQSALNGKESLTALFCWL